MTRCTCLWTARRESTAERLEMAVLLPDPVCPAGAVHDRTSARGLCSCPLGAVVEHPVCLTV